MINPRLRVIAIRGGAGGAAPIIGVAAKKGCVPCGDADRQAGGGHRVGNANRVGLVVFHAFAAAIRVQGFQHAGVAVVGPREGGGAVGSDQGGDEVVVGLVSELGGEADDIGDLAEPVEAVIIEESGASERISDAGDLVDVAGIGVT